MTNKREVKLAEINDISCEVRRRRWNWLGDILGREGENDCFTALGWTAEGQRTRGRPKKRVSMGPSKNYLERDNGEKAKQSWVEELGSSQLKRLHKIESVGRMRLDDDKTLTLAGQKSKM
ncbi:unnamed protein product [Porites evermanni]|uniref:Uncharacterized protein n=1 Tax=Porites evermanni TaxID=104178 RepID=A0ABN8MGI0_9CNID|nr:unnamed protein product [Porites evermanni]